MYDGLPRPLNRRVFGTTALEGRRTDELIDPDLFKIGRQVRDGVEPFLKSGDRNDVHLKLGFDDPLDRDRNSSVWIPELGRRAGGLAVSDLKFRI